MFVSTFTHKTKKMIGISMGIVMVSYMLQIIATMFEDLEFLKYLSTFSLADMRNVITEGVINPITIVITIVASIILYLVTLFRYDRKELV
jgi:ABC-2 type transport system permease protein